MGTRIRTIKPQFWADEKLGRLTPITRLVFLGLISAADDYGRLVDSLKQIDASIFPHTDDSAADSLTQLAELGRIRRGPNDSGQPVIEIVNWAKHQRVDRPNPLGAIAPITPIDSRAVREGFASELRTERELGANHPRGSHDVLVSVEGPLSVPVSTSARVDQSQPGPTAVGAAIASTFARTELERTDAAQPTGSKVERLRPPTPEPPIRVLRSTRRGRP